MHNTITLQALDLKNNPGLIVAYSTFDTPFGGCLVASTDKGIGTILFFDTVEEGIRDLQSRWRGVTTSAEKKPEHALIQNYFLGKQGIDGLSFHVRGTPFQIKVWNALLTIPKGSTTTYGHIAKTVASRGFQAAGSAIGNNPIGYIVPCHRVLQANGAIGGFRWGIERKRAMLAAEGIQT